MLKFQNKFQQYFQIEFFKEEGISDDMANYITMALDPSAGAIYQLMSRQISNYEDRIAELEDQLDQVLLSKNITILDLFHRIAIR